MKKSFEIADAIVAFIQGNISEEELVMLEEWLEQSEENRSLFVSVMDEEVFSERRQQMDATYLNTVFGNLKLRKQARQQEERFRKRLRWWTGVAAGIVLVLGIGWLCRPEQERTELGEVRSEITVGQQKAFLTLASGEKIELEAQRKDTITTVGRQEKIILNQGQIRVENMPSERNGSVGYHLMEVPRGAEYSLILADGTRVWLNADSKLKFPVTFGAQRRYVELTGEAYFAVTHDEKRPFVVHSDEVEVTVLGTEFGISHYVGKPTLTTLVQGRVEVTDKGGGKTILKPGQQAVTENGKSIVREVETLYYTAWKDGYFIFENTPLEDIMEKLALWYNCQYFFENYDVARLRITARLKKYDEIDVLLSILSKTREIEFEKKGNTVLIRKK